MSVMIFNLRQFQRMAAVLLAAEPTAAAQPLTIDALAEVFAAASFANHAAFRATYGERADSYLARMGEARQPVAKQKLIAGFAEALVTLDPELALSDAELLLYNTADNDGGEHLNAIERIAVERVVDLVVEACHRLIRTGQRGSERLRMIDGRLSPPTTISLQDRR